MTNLTRREWLQGAAACSAGGLLAGGRAARTRANAPLAQIPLGFSLYGMKGLQTAEALRVCAEVGYDAVELALLPGWPTEPGRLTPRDRRELGRRLADSGLALAGLMENLAEPAPDAGHRANLDRLKAAAELGHELAPEAPPVIETVLGGKPGAWEQVRGRLAERLRSWAEVAAGARAVLAVKPHVAHALHTPEGALWLLRQVDSPWLRLAFDYSHFALRGLPFAKAMAALLPGSAFLHVKDARGDADKFEFLLPGEGATDYVDFFKRVRAAGFGGPAVVEVSAQVSGRRGYDPVAAARQSYAKLAAAMRMAGVRSR